MHLKEHLFSDETYMSARRHKGKMKMNLFIPLFFVAHFDIYLYVIAREWNGRKFIARAKQPKCHCEGVERTKQSPALQAGRLLRSLNSAGNDYRGWRSLAMTQRQWIPSVVDAFSDEIRWVATFWNYELCRPSGAIAGNYDNILILLNLAGAVNLNIFP